MNQRLRVALLLLMGIGTFTIAPGCTAFKEPTKIETTEDFLRLPRVNTTKAADKYAMKSHEAEAKRKGYR
jgi:hypothetical protein